MGFRTKTIRRAADFPSLGLNNMCPARSSVPRILVLWFDGDVSESSALLARRRPGCPETKLFNRQFGSFSTKGQHGPAIHIHWQRTAFILSAEMCSSFAEEDLSQGKSTVDGETYHSMLSGVRCATSAWVGPAFTQSHTH